MSRKPPPRRGGTSASRPTVEEIAAAHLANGKTLLALEMLDLQIEQGRDTGRTWQLMASGLTSLGELAHAIGAWERASERNPTSWEDQFQLAACHFRLGNVDAAVDGFSQIAQDHDHLNAWCNLATIIPGDSRADNQKVLSVRREFATRLARAEPQRLDQPLPVHTTRPRLRIGYVSAFFHRENYMKPVWELLRLHDRRRFEIHLFSDSDSTEDLAWFHPGQHDQIHRTSAMDNLSLATKIRELHLDVLIDLNAYSIPQRLGLFTHRLASVVAGWFNMYATSGLPMIDWIIGDDHVVAAEEERFYTERVARLPHSYLTFHVSYAAPPVKPPPCLKHNKLTFGSFVSQYKITPTVYETWARVLSECPGTQLVLANRQLDSQGNRDYVLESFQRLGIDKDRIRLLPPAPHREFLTYYDQIDVALDSFPYNGGTTTTEAMWQGVPTLTLKGDRWAARTSRTLLENGNLASCVHDSVDDLVREAARMHQDKQTPHHLADLRQTMRTRLKQSPVCDVQSMTGHFESLLESLVELRAGQA